VARTFINDCSAYRSEAELFYHHCASGEQLSRTSAAETVDSAADPRGASNVDGGIEGALAVYPGVTFPRGSAK
jgi:hypothetical protein